MRRDDGYFGEQELVLVYIGKRLRESQGVERLFEEAGLEYLVEPDSYRGGVLFVRELIGAFFYVAEGDAERARGVLRGARKKPYETMP